MAVITIILKEDGLQKRTNSWHNRFRKLLVRYEKKIENYFALVCLGCCILIHRRITLGQVLSLIDLVVLVGMFQLLPIGAGSIGIYFFDSLIVTLIIFSFCRRMKEFKQWRRFLFQNWYEIPGMIPIFFLPWRSLMDSLQSG